MIRFLLRILLRIWWLIVGRSQSAIWSERERRIYRFHDGTAFRDVDPLAIHRALILHGGDQWSALLGVLEAAKFDAAKHLPDAAVAHSQHVARSIEELVKLIRSAFQVSPFSSSGGLTDAECLDLLGDYLRWVGRMEAEFRPLANGQHSTGPLPSANVESPTEPSSDSGLVGSTSENGKRNP